MLRARFGARVTDMRILGASALVLGPTLCVLGTVGFVGMHFCDDRPRKQEKLDKSDTLDKEWRRMRGSPDFDAEHGPIPLSSESDPPPWRIFVK
jgi:hypothetical protein